MANRPRKTPANPGRASIDLGGIFGAFGGGTAGAVEGVPMEDAGMDPSASYDEAVASAPASRAPMTTLRAVKPGWFENAVTRGAAGNAYRDLDARLQMQQQQQAFAAQQSALQRAAALEQLRTSAGLQNESQLAQEQRRIAEAERLRQQAEGDFQVGQNDYRLALLSAGLQLPQRFTSRGSAETVLGGGRLGSTGLAGSSVVADAQDLRLRELEGASKIGYAQQNPELAGQSYGATLTAPIQALGMNERRMTLGEQGLGLDKDRFGLDERRFDESQLQNMVQNRMAAEQLKLSQEQLAMQRQRPDSVGGGVFMYDGQWYGVTPAADAASQIVEDPETGRKMINNIPARGPQLQRLPGVGGQRRAVGTIPPPSSGVSSAPIQPSSNPAPAPAAYPPDLSLLSGGGGGMMSRPVQQPMYETQQVGGRFISTPREQPTQGDIIAAQRRLQSLLSRPLNY